MPKTRSPLPLTAFEEYMFRDDRPAYPMSIVARLRFVGRMDRDAAAAAFAAAVARHLLLQSTVRNNSKIGLEWVAADRVPALQWSDEAAHEDLPAMQPIDLTKEPGLRAWAADEALRSTMVLQFHHAACDGKAVLRVIDDFLRGYARAIEGDRSTIELAPCEDKLLHKRASFGLTAWKFLKMLPAQLSGLIPAANFLIRQPAPLLPKACGTPRVPPINGMGSVPYTFPNVRTGRLGAKELCRLSALAASENVTVNDWLVRDFYVAADDFRRRNQADGSDWLRFSVPIDLRQPADARMPAANVVSMLFLDRNAAQIADRSALLHGIHDEIASLRRRQLGLTFIWSLMALRVLPGGLAGRVNNGRCEATCVVSNLGRVLADSTLPAQDGKIVTGNLALDEFDFFAPIREGTAVSVGLVFYADELQICLHYDARHITAAQADDLLASYMQTIRASLGAEGPAARDIAA